MSKRPYLIEVKQADGSVAFRAVNATTAARAYALVEESVLSKPRALKASEMFGLFEQNVKLEEAE